MFGKQFQNVYLNDSDGFGKKMEKNAQSLKPFIYECINRVSKSLEDYFS